MNVTSLIIVQVIFSDETYVDVDPTIRSHYVRRSRGEQIIEQHVAAHRPYRQRQLFWGCFSGAGGPGSLLAINGTMRTATYVNALQQHLLPYQQEHFGASRGIFMQDNAPCHKAAATMAFLQAKHVRVLDWPPYSPDLNPIENLWATLKAKVHQAPLPTRQAVMEAAQRVWADESIKNACMALAASMPRRIDECVKSKGGYTHY